MKVLVTTAVLLAMFCASVAPAAAQGSDTQMSYMVYCSRCHGESGKGDGPSGASLSKKPRNFTDCATMKQIDDATLFKVIKDGGQAADLSPEMPAWSAGLSDKEIHDLVTYIRGFCER